MVHVHRLVATSFVILDFPQDELQGSGVLTDHGWLVEVPGRHRYIDGDLEIACLVGMTWLGGPDGYHVQIKAYPQLIVEMLLTRPAR